MIRTVAETARILGVDAQQLKAWAWTFKEFLSRQANPGKRRPRSFTDSDVLALMLVAFYWEDDPDIEAIQARLGSEDHFDSRFREILYRHTPILQEPPEGLDETWRHGVFLNGGTVDGYLALARSYRESADELLNSALQSGEPREWGYPVLFAYRHSLELYLKVVGEISATTHSLERCVALLEKHHGQRIPAPARDWITELDAIDPRGTTFRYADEEAEAALRYAEYWVDFNQLKHAMGCVFDMLDHAALRLMGGVPPPRIP
jgi:hypothetical protein